MKNWTYSPIFFILILNSVKGKWIVSLGFNLQVSKVDDYIQSQ